MFRVMVRGGESFLVATDQKTKLRFANVHKTLLTCSHFSRVGAEDSYQLSRLAACDKIGRELSIENRLSVDQ